MSKQNEEHVSRETGSFVREEETEKWLEAIRERLKYVKKLPVGTPCDGCARMCAEFTVWVRSNGGFHPVPMCRICVRETLIGFAGFTPPW